MIKAVIFDIGGVVVVPRYEKMYKYVVPGMAFLLNPFISKSKRLYGYVELYKDTRKLNKDVIDIIHSLQDAGYKTPSLSNATFESMKANEHLGFYKYFDPMVVSEKIGVKKPDRRAYEITIERIGMQPEECVFVDNMRVNVTAAEEFGMKGIHFKNAKQLKKELKGHGVEIE